MNIPTLLFGSLVAALLGAVYHMIRGGNLGRLLLDLLLAIGGFWAGHYLAQTLGFTMGSLGSIRLLAAGLTSLLALVIGNWLANLDSSKR